MGATSKVATYRQRLRELPDWTSYLRAESGLPGPRGNLELARAVAEEASPRRIEELLAVPPDEAPENSSGVFLVFCGVAALGKLVASGDHAQLNRLRAFASDSRWRIREAVAIGLQYYGDSDAQSLVRVMRDWAAGSWYEKRAAAAALCEPRLLREEKVARQVLSILDGITRDVAAKPDGTEAFKTLRKSMGYCWSVAVAACPEQGKPLLEGWIKSPSGDVRRILKQNLMKNRLRRMDSTWVAHSLADLDASR